MENLVRVLETLIKLQANLRKSVNRTVTEKFIKDKRLEVAKAVKYAVDVVKVLKETEESQLMNKFMSQIFDIQKDIEARLEVLPREEENMAEKFDLRTATSLLPICNETEDSVKDLIDAIELFSSILDENEIFFL